MKTNRYKGSAYYQLKELGLTDPTPRYYVYFLIDPRNDTVFYIGKGCKSGGKERMLRHVKDVRKGKICNGINGKLFRRIKSLLDVGLEPAYEKPQENMVEIEALALEAAFIDYHGMENLCNYVAGGFGNSNCTPERKKQISEATKAAMQRPENRFISQWGNAKSVFTIAIRNHGTWDNFQKHKQELKRKELLKKDLYLLRTIINTMRNELRVTLKPMSLEQKLERKRLRNKRYKEANRERLKDYYRLYNNTR